MKISLTDNKANRPFVKASDPTRQVTINVTMVSGGKEVFTNDIDVTNYAKSRVRMSRNEAIATAFHEAGHAVVNNPRVTGTDVAFITILGGTSKELKYLGYARYEPVQGIYQSPDKNMVLAKLAQLAAGSVTQQMAGFSEDAGWNNDLEQMRDLTMKYLVDWGLEPEFYGLKRDKEGKLEGPPELVARVAVRQMEMINQAKIDAKAVVEHKWGLVKSVVLEIIRNGNINGQKYTELRSEFKGKEIPTFKQTVEEATAKREEIDARRQEQGKKPLPARTDFRSGAAKNCMMDILLEL